MRLLALIAFGDEEAEVAEILAGGACNHCVAEGGEHGAGIECGKRRLQVESEGVGAGDGSWVGDGAGYLGIAVDAVGASAEHGEALTLILFQFECAGHDELLVSAAGSGRAVDGYSNLTNRDET